MRSLFVVGSVWVVTALAASTTACSSDSEANSDGDAAVSVGGSAPDAASAVPSASDSSTSEPTASDSLTSEPTASDSPTSEPTASDSPTSEPTASAPPSDSSTSDEPADAAVLTSDTPASEADAGAVLGDDAGAGSTHWRPAAGLSWQWQLSTDVQTPLDVAVYDIDWEADPSDVAALHALGIRVICYVSVGSWEDFRPDADAFDEAVLGEDYEGWPGERYVDIRSAELRAIMQQRFDVCQASGFDAIEPDNMDVYELGSDSGFELTREDGIEYARWLADEAHARGLGIGQKNAASITGEISDQYDWALTESCYSDGDWCGELDAYVAAGKPVFMCEYEPDSFQAACNDYLELGYSPILKSLDLDAEVTFCP